MSESKSKYPRKKNQKTLITCPAVKEKYASNAMASRDIQNKEYQSLLKCMSTENRDNFKKDETKNKCLYPHKDDPLFNSKIASKKEFFDTRYDPKTKEDYDNIIKISQQLCNNTEFELEPHQMFVRNFLSFQTPYNSLLLYHGLGTGKTCSAISVCEEMRTYNKQIGNNKRMLIIASPAVQENFKIQLFDERKLKNVNGLWNIKACTGNKFIMEINPMNMKGLNRGRVIRQIKKLISQSYHFLGYIEFSNYITRVTNKSIRKGDDKDVRKRKRQRAIKKEFSNRMLVIDEVHNMRITEDGKIKKSSQNLIDIVSYTDNLKLLILSATPMFNSYTEIIWLLNLMNLNDKRFPISEKEVFDKRGNFLEDDKGHEIGKNLLIQKASGYISYVKGNNPFTFPNSIWPNEALNPDSLRVHQKDIAWKYPEKQINGGSTIPPIELLDLVLVNIGTYQSTGYNFIVTALKKKYPILNNPDKGLSYTFLEGPLQALNMIYPDANLEDMDPVSLLYGKRGLSRTMYFNPVTKKNFRYKEKTLTHFGKIFSYDEIGKYSGKIKYILKSIKDSEGIVFIYSQYIDGGAVPIALALEEMGFTRYSGNSLFEKPPSEPIDAFTMKPASKKAIIYPAKYIMITGDKNLTPNVTPELKAVTSPNNTNGERVKVVIVSKAGSEGLDFKNIRQMHILDPWYNLNRQEQTIGRAVRNFSHCALPYKKRNVGINLYGTLLENNEVEAIDMYIYRLAERKAKQVAKVARILKENAVDCLLNSKALNFSQGHIDKTVIQELSNGRNINFPLGNKDNSVICDFTKCEYKCNPTNILDIENINDDTYSEDFIQMNLDKILQRIRFLFRDRYIYHKIELRKHIRHFKKYPRDQIYSALNFLVTEKNEYITDLLGRLGHLVNIGDYYMFQPVEIENKHISRLERVKPIDYKRHSLIFNLPSQISDDRFTRNIEVGLNENSQINKILLQNLEDLQNPAVVGSEHKNNWVRHCAWAIFNLDKYNKIPKKDLLSYAMNHIMDSLSYYEKVRLLKYITLKEDAEEGGGGGGAPAIDKYIKDYMEKHMFTGGKYKGIAFARLDKPSNHEQYSILTKDGKEWGVNELALGQGLGGAFFGKFQKPTDKINDFIGFMINFKGDQIVFKTKYTEASERGRSNKGQRCDRGESKGVIIKKINKLLEPDNKYKLGKNHRSLVDSIYGKTDIKQTVETATGKDKVVKINSLQLCAEMELWIRHFQAIHKNEKTWFFSTLETIVNKIEKLKK